MCPQLRLTGTSAWESNLLVHMQHCRNSVQLGGCISNYVMYVEVAWVFRIEEKILSEDIVPKDNDLENST